MEMKQKNNQMKDDQNMVATLSGCRPANHFVTSSTVCCTCHIEIRSLLFGFSTDEDRSQRGWERERRRCIVHVQCQLFDESTFQRTKPEGPNYEGGSRLVVVVVVVDVQESLIKPNLMLDKSQSQNFSDCTVVATLFPTHQFDDETHSSPTLSHSVSGTLDYTQTHLAKATWATQDGH